MNITLCKLFCSIWKHTSVLINRINSNFGLLNWGYNRGKIMFSPSKSTLTRVGELSAAPSVTTLSFDCYSCFLRHLLFSSSNCKIDFVQMPCSPCSCSQSENLLNPFDIVGIHPMPYYQGLSNSKWLGALRWTQNIHIQLSAFARRRLLIFVVTLVICKSLFLVVHSFERVSQTPQVFLQLINTLLEKLTFSIWSPSRHSGIL